MSHLPLPARVALTLLVPLAVVGPAWGAKVEEKTLVTMGEGVKLTLGPKNHIAAIIPKGSKMAGVVDGVEGPKVDAFFPANPDNMNGSPFTFDDEGEHSAYAARQGNELVIVLDGKEHARYKEFRQNRPFAYPLTLSPSGGKLCYALERERGGPQFFFDGKEQPIANGEVKWNADGSKYVYRVARAGAGGGTDFALIVNGEEKKIRAKQFGMTTDGKVIAFVEPLDGSKPSVMLDDAVVTDSLGYAPTQLTLGPAGSWAFAAMRQTEETDIYFNGAKVAELPKGTTPEAPRMNGITDHEAKEALIISPDGKKIAIAVKSEAGAASVLLDGKAAGEYGSVGNIVFTGDSSKLAYVANARNGAKFVVINDEESNPIKDMQPDWLAVSPKADIVFYYTQSGPRESTLWINHKKVGTVPYSGAMGRPQFTANGKNIYLFVPANFLWLNGTTIPVEMTSLFAINHDASKWAIAQVNKNGQWEMIADKKQTVMKGNRLHAMAYTPDGKHLVTAMQTGRNDEVNGIEISIDGTKLKSIDQFGVGQGNDSTGFETHSDGSLSFLSSEGDELKRVTIARD